MGVELKGRKWPRLTVYFLSAGFTNADVSSRAPCATSAYQATKASGVMPFVTNSS